MRPLLVAAALFALGGCGNKVDNAAEPQQAATNVAQNATNSADDVAAKVAALNDDQRNGVFLRAIRDAEIPCRDVIKSERLEDSAGTPTWRAQCELGDAHLILIKPDGSAQVMSRPTR